MSGSLRARAPGSLPLPTAVPGSGPARAAFSSIAQTDDGPSPFPREFLSCRARFLLSRPGGGRYQLAGASVTQAYRKHTLFCVGTGVGQDAVHFKPPRIVLEGRTSTVHVRQAFTTTIRLPEPVNSVVV